MRDRAEVLARLHLVIERRRRWEQSTYLNAAEERLICSVEISALRWALGEDDGEAAMLSREP
jgi:hypothetical protein